MVLFFFFFFWFSDFIVFSFGDFLVLLLCLGAFMVKLPVFFFHLWLPKAHVEAPVSGSMILAAVLLKLGGYGVYRILVLCSFFNFINFGFLIVFVLWGGVITSLICLCQSDLKCLVAYSSVGHMAVMIVGILSGSVWGTVGGLMMMVGHGLCSSCLFVLVTLGYEFVSSRSLVVVKGVMVCFPSLSFWWFLASVGNMAAPPSLNLASELFLAMSILGYSFFLFLFFGLLSFLVGAYSLYMFVSSNHGFVVEGFVGVSSLKFYVYLSLFLHLFPLFFFFSFLDFFV